MFTGILFVTTPDKYNPGPHRQAREKSEHSHSVEDIIGRNKQLPRESPRRLSQDLSTKSVSCKILYFYILC